MRVFPLSFRLDVLLKQLLLQLSPSLMFVAVAAANILYCYDDEVPLQTQMTTISTIKIVCSAAVAVAVATLFPSW